MRKLLIAGNWKMNGDKAQIRALLQGLSYMLEDLNAQIDCIVCPPNVYLDYVNSITNRAKIQLGAQNVASANFSAFTGEISPLMLREFGCNYAIIGHSERRRLVYETDELVANKFQVAVDGGLHPILCVGETAEQQAAGNGFAVVGQQLQAVIAKVGIAAFKHAVIAYEPVWAIGTGLSATPEQAQAMHAHIRALIAVHDTHIAAVIRIIYGGSMNKDNAAMLLQQVDIDGGLIGGAALKAQDFSDICHIAMGMTK